MAINLLNLLKDQLGDGIIQQAAGLIGENTSTTKSAIGTILPTLLGSVVSKGSTEGGAGKLLSLISDGKHDGSMFSNLTSLLGGGAASDGLMNTGKSLVSSIMGGNQNSIMDMVGKATGLKSSSSSGLMSMLAPMVMGMIGKQVASKGLNASGLMNLLGSQKEHLSGALPSGMGDLLGFAKSTGKTAQATAQKATKTMTPEPSSSGGGGGFLKWGILGLAALALLAYFGLRPGDAVDSASNAVKDTAGSVVDAAGKAGNAATSAAGNAVDGVKSMAGNTVDAAGNMVDEAGNIVTKAGDLTKDAAGNMVDASGNVVSSAKDAMSAGKDAAGAVAGAAKNMADGAAGGAGHFSVDAAGNLLNPDGEIAFEKGQFTVSDDGFYLDENGNKIGGVFKKIGKAMGDAAGATGEFFKNGFNKMFKKEAGAESVYDLSDITWDPEKNRITNYSKEEIQGLAEALKENPDSKIVVQSFTSDGGNKVKNKALSKTRAKVIHDILVTFGVKDSQISAKGLGSKDDVGNKLQIVVE